MLVSLDATLAINMIRYPVNCWNKIYIFLSKVRQARD